MLDVPYLKKLRGAANYHPEQLARVNQRIVGVKHQALHDFTPTPKQFGGAHGSAKNFRVIFKKPTQPPL